MNVCEWHAGGAWVACRTTSRRQARLWRGIGYTVLWRAATREWVTCIPVGCLGFAPVPAVELAVLNSRQVPQDQRLTG